MKYLYLIWSNLMRKKLRTLLTVLSIMAAFLLFGYLSAITTGLNQGVSVAGLDRLTVRHKVSIVQPLPVSYRARIERIPGVDAVSHASWFGGQYQKPSNFFPQMPVDPIAHLDMYPEYLISDEYRQAWLSTRDGAIAGRKLAQRYGWKVGDRIPILATIWVKKDGNRLWDFELVGIFDGAEKNTDTGQFFFRYDYFEESLAEEMSGLVGWYVVRIENSQEATRIAAAIDSEFANSPAETKAEPEGAFIQGFANQVGDIGMIMTAIVSAVFFTILLVAANTMAYTVRERTNELAVLKAIGFTDLGVLGLVLGESLLLAMLGGLLGLGLAWFLVSLGDPSGGALPAFYIPVGNMIIGVAIIGVMAVLAGIMPAFQALRLRIADALRR